MIRHTVALSSAALLFLLPAAATASTLSETKTPGVHGAIVQYRAGGGETNDLTVDFTAGMVFEDDGASITPGRGCVATATGAACTTRPVELIDALLRDGDDQAVIHGYGRVLDVHMSGGPGNDTASVVASADAQVEGDSGDDILTAEGDMTAVADGGSGDDIVTVAPYIAFGKGTGGSGNDRLYFRPAGLGQSDADLDGGTGADVVIAWPQPKQRENGTSTLKGGNGNDVIAVKGTALPWPMVGYTIDGGDGDDTLLGGPGADIVEGGAGRDVIDVQDGGADTVTCGDGVDVVRPDDADSVAPDCEIDLSRAP